jgi:hypothetical protein
MGVVAITGSATGIGAAVRRRLEQGGDLVIGVDVQTAEVRADLSTPAGRRQAVDGVLATCGGRLDRLVVCAGIGGHLPDLAKIASVNYFGAVDVLDGRPRGPRGRGRRGGVLEQRALRSVRGAPLRAGLPRPRRGARPRAGGARERLRRLRRLEARALARGAPARRRLGASRGSG